MSLAGAEIQTMTFQPRFCALQPHLPHRNWPFAHHGRAPFKWPVLRGTSFEVVTSKLSGTQSRLALSLYALKEFCRPSAWLTCSRNRAPLWSLSAAPGVPKRVTHPSTVLAQCCLTWSVVSFYWNRSVILLFRSHTVQKMNGKTATIRFNLNRSI